jgi:hypothetical protein
MGEFFLELLKGCMAFLVKVPGSAFPGKPDQWNDDIGVSKDESSVEVAEV